MTEIYAYYFQEGRRISSAFHHRPSVLSFHGPRSFFILKHAYTVHAKNCRQYMHNLFVDGRHVREQEVFGSVEVTVCACMYLNWK
jgi:hypothetical protein